MARINFTIPELSTSELACFWAKVAPPDVNGCELWIAGRSVDSYGFFAIRRDKQARKYLTHRLAYFLYHGTQPGALEVCHECDNPPCVARAHLFLGTRMDNVLNAMSKNRLATGDRNGSRIHPESRKRGEAHWSATLSESQVREIRALKGMGKLQREVGAMFGVRSDIIGLIWRGKTWKHVT